MFGMRVGDPCRIALVGQRLRYDLGKSEARSNLMQHDHAFAFEFCGFLASVERQRVNSLLILWLSLVRNS